MAEAHKWRSESDADENVQLATETTPRPLVGMVNNAGTVDPGIPARRPSLLLALSPTYSLGGGIGDNDRRRLVILLEQDFLRARRAE